MTMTFVVMGLGTVLNALTNRREPASGLAAPLLTGVLIGLAPVTLIVLATQLPTLQAGLRTTALTGGQWLTCIGLALVLPVVVEARKWLLRRRAPTTVVTDVRAIAPAHAVADLVR
jgi:Ca2+-transporting ATPase